MAKFYRYLLFGSTALLLYCCGGTKEKASSDISNLLAGNWISKNYSDSLALCHSMKKLHGNCEELIFTPGSDTMWTINVGLEVYPLKITSNGEHSFRINKFNQDDFTDFTLSADGMLLSYDYKKFKEKYSFVKMPDIFAREELQNGWKAASTYFINQQLLAGDYDELGAQEPTTRKTFSFNADGSLQGMEEYTNYSICTGGDCSSMCDKDLINFTNGCNEEMFHWQFSNDTLTLFHVDQVNAADEFPVLEPGEVFMMMVRTE